MSNRIYVLNGPNLNLLGQREPAVYGTTTLDEIRGRCVETADTLGFEIDFRQTNFEGELIESVHQARTEACGIIINPAGYTFTSIALLDALKMFDRTKDRAAHLERPCAREHLSQLTDLQDRDRHHHRIGRSRI